MKKNLALFAILLLIIQIMVFTSFQETQAGQSEESLKKITEVKDEIRILAASNSPKEFKEKIDTYLRETGLTEEEFSKVKDNLLLASISGKDAYENLMYVEGIKQIPQSKSDNSKVNRAVEEISKLAESYKDNQLDSKLNTYLQEKPLSQEELSLVKSKFENRKLVRGKAFRIFNHIQDIQDNKKAAAAVVDNEDPSKACDEILSHKKQYALSKDLCSSGFIPTKKVSIKGQDFYITNKIISDKDSRFKTVIYAKDKKGMFLPRFLYLSNSSGTWRSAPYTLTFPQKHYAKGKEIHYTQETMVDDSILDVLHENLEKANGKFETFEHCQKKLAKKNPTLSVMFDLFTLPEELNTFSEESTVYDDKGKLAFLQKGKDMPGHIGGENYHIPETLKEINSVLKTEPLKNFVPEFKDANKIQEFHTIHTLLSEKDNNTFKKDILVRVFKGTLNGDEVHWYMNSDKDGRIWIEKIVLANDNLTTYGTYAHFINSGLLTNKPLEYTSQSKTIPKEMKKYFGDQYNDISLMNNELSPISEYRKAYNIPINFND